MKNLFPSPKYNIGDIVRFVDSDLDEIAIVVGLRLCYYDCIRRHVWYYAMADKISAPSVTRGWHDVNVLEAAEAKTENQKGHINGGEVPIREVIACWNCEQPRIDDCLDCPYCGASDEQGVPSVTDLNMDVQKPNF